MFDLGAVYSSHSFIRETFPHPLLRLCHAASDARLGEDVGGDVPVVARLASLRAVYIIPHVVGRLVGLKG